MVMKKVAIHKCLKFIVNLIMWATETQQKHYLVRANSTLRSELYPLLADSVNLHCDISACALWCHLIKLVYALKVNFSGRTVKPMMRDHPTGQQKVVLWDRWSLITGSYVLKCRTMLLQQWSLIRSQSLIALVSHHRFHSIDLLMCKVKVFEEFVFHMQSLVINGWTHMKQGMKMLLASGVNVFFEITSSMIPSCYVEKWWIWPSCGLDLVLLWITCINAICSDIQRQCFIMKN